jgi:hypothetical protein
VSGSSVLAIASGILDAAAARRAPLLRRRGAARRAAGAGWRSRGLAAASAARAGGAARPRSFGLPAGRRGARAGRAAGPLIWRGRWGRRWRREPARTRPGAGPASEAAPVGACAAWGALGAICRCLVARLGGSSRGLWASNGGQSQLGLASGPDGLQAWWAGATRPGQLRACRPTAPPRAPPPHPPPPPTAAAPARSPGFTRRRAPLSCRTAAPHRRRPP